MLSLIRVCTLAAVLLAAAYGPVRRFCAGGAVAPALLQKPLANQVWVVTGANIGIGYETALQLLRQNATVVLACRNATRAAGAAAAMRAAAPHALGDVVPMELDLTRLASVDAFALALLERYPRLDGLIANAGVMLPSPATRTADGFELQIGVNHLGHFYLTELLCPRLTASAPSRIVILSSRASEHGDLSALEEDLDWAGGLPATWLGSFKAYADSKLANALHARGLAARLVGTRVTVAAVHPGVVRTALFRDVPLLGAYADSLLAPVTHTLFKSPWEGAQTTLYAALDESVVPQHSGAYYSDAALVRVHANPQARDDALARRLWDASLELVGLARV